MKARRTLRLLTVAAVCGALALPGAATAQAAPTSGGAGALAAAPTAQKYYWKWSDGSQKTARTFKQSTYHSADNLPQLIVTARPAKPSVTVRLEFKQKGTWVLESKVRTNSKGVGTLSLIPYCDNNKWCSGTWEYRLKVGGQSQVLRLTYSRK